MEMIGLVVGIAGAAVSFAGAQQQADALRQQAQMEQQMAEYKNKLDIQQANEQQASAQRKAQQEQLKTKYVQSQFLAQAAASGTAPTSGDLLLTNLNIAGEGEYSELSTQYAGLTEAASSRAQGQLDLYQGDIEAQALNARADATQMAGLGGLFGSLGGALSKFG